MSSNASRSPAQIEKATDRWWSIGLSVALHGVLVAALAWGWYAFRVKRPPAPTPAIEAQVVDARTLKAAPQPPAPAPQPAPAPVPTPAPEPVPDTSGPPQPDAEELARREQARIEEQQHEEARRQQEQRLEAERVQREAQQRAEAGKQARERAQAERKAREAAAAKAREEQRRLAEQKRAEEARRQAEAQDKAQREAELRASLAAEEHANAARSSAALASWQAQIAARIQRAWLRPPTAQPGISCELHVTQVPGGTVTNVRLGNCNGDAAVRESIIAAAYRASPLPAPSDPAIFDPNLDITFHPE